MPALLVGQPRADAEAEGAHSLLKDSTVLTQSRENRENPRHIDQGRRAEDRKRKPGQGKSLNRWRRGWWAAEAEGWQELMCGSPGRDRRTHGSPGS